MTNAKRVTSTHNTIRRLKLHLLPGPDASPPESSPHILQVLADDAVDGRMKLNLGRRVECSKVNIDLLKEWLTSCEGHHATSCAPAVNDHATTFTFRLVDVEDRCVVSSSPDVTYVALSYTWGDPDHFNHLKLTSASSQRLHTKGALSDDNPDLPTTIKDALRLCAQLGETYIWIDAICIQQDDEKDKASQIPYMDKIYGCAKLTIVAGAGSNAWAGLPGVGTRPKLRSIAQLYGTVCGIPLVTCLESYHQWRLGSTWDTRGWTFQEKALSRRLLIFGTEQAYFQCKSDLWCEDTICETFDEDVISKTLEVDNYGGGFPFTQYSLYLGHYVHRSFGYRSDVLNAFCGLENHLRPHLSHEFHWGLPVSMFDAAIGWTFPYHYPDRKRANFPTWAWAGWDFSGLWQGFAFRYPTYRTVGREVLWHRVCTTESIRKIIDSRLPEFVKPGPGKTMGHLEYIQTSKNISIMGPLPILPSGLPMSHILQFWTSSARLKVGRTPSQDRNPYINSRFPELHKMQNNDYVNILSLDERVIGHINLDRDWRSSRPDWLEFIVISRYCPYPPTDTDPDGFYVLLIEWTSGIAYRVHAPEQSIQAEDWTKMDPEWKLISLA